MKLSSLGWADLNIYFFSFSAKENLFLIIIIYYTFSHNLQTLQVIPVACIQITESRLDSWVEWSDNVLSTNSERRSRRCSKVLIGGVPITWKSIGSLSEMMRLCFISEMFKSFGHLQSNYLEVDWIPGWNDATMFHWQPVDIWLTIDLVIFSLCLMRTYTDRLHSFMETVYMLRSICGFIVINVAFFIWSLRNSVINIQF